MFRAHDEEKNMGVFFVLEHKYGLDDSKVIWRPDSEEVNPRSMFVNSMLAWEDSRLAKEITRLNEIEVSEGTESIKVAQVSMDASPFLKTAASCE
jgi:hypothetical protein